MLLSFLLLLAKFHLAGNIASVEVTRNVLTDGRDGARGNDAAECEGLNLFREYLLQLFSQTPPFLLYSAARHDTRECRHLFFRDQDVELYYVRRAHRQELIGE